MCLVQLLRQHVGLLYPTLECLGPSPASTSKSSLLLCVGRRQQGRLQYLDPYRSHGKPALKSWLLDLPGPDPAVVEHLESEPTRRFPLSVITILILILVFHSLSIESERVSLYLITVFFQLN